jgi:hypothetical protein
MTRFISEDDIKTFDGWLKYQGYDPTMLAPDDLAKWREVFDKIRRKPDAKVGLMRLGAKVPGDRIYAVAVRDSGLWLTLWVRRSWKSEFFVFMPRPNRDVHASYHRDGTFHHKGDGHTFAKKQLQPLDRPFKDTEHLSAWGGHGPKTIGAVCEPKVFAGGFVLPPGVLGPSDGMVVVDLVEPGRRPITWPGTLVRKKVFKDAVPWLVIRIVTQSLPGERRGLDVCRMALKRFWQRGLSWWYSWRLF